MHLPSIVQLNGVDMLRQPSVFVSILPPRSKPQLREEAKAWRMFAFRSMLAPRVAIAWASEVRRAHADLGASAPTPRVLGKPLRSYLKAGWTPKQRHCALQADAAAAAQTFAPHTLAALLSGKRFALCQLVGRKGANFQLVFCASFVVHTQREGEWALTLFKVGDPAPLARLTFNLAADATAQPVIGGLQGPHGGRKRAVIEATRALHGLRPKDAVLLAMRALAAALGAGDVLAVSDANHVLERLRDTAKHSDYDGYWRERGASEDAAFGFRFARLEPACGNDGRGRMKASVIDGVEAFVAAYANPRR